MFLHDVVRFCALRSAAFLLPGSKVNLRVCSSVSIVYCNYGVQKFKEWVPLIINFNFLMLKWFSNIY